MRGIETDRGQHRHHFAEKIALDPFGLARGEVRPAQEPDAFIGEPRQDLLIEQAVLRCDQLVRFLRHLPEQMIGGHALRSDRGRTGLDLGLQARNADLEELVEVAADDAQESQPFEQRRCGVFRLRQHAPVERELTQLAIQVELRNVAWLVHGTMAAQSRVERDVACPLDSIS